MRCWSGSGSRGRALRRCLESGGIVMGQQDAFERILASLHDSMLDDAHWSGVSALLERLVEGALPASGAAAVSGSILLRRSPVLPPFVIHVKPVGVPQPDYGARHVAALVLIVEPGRQRRVDPDLVARGGRRVHLAGRRRYAEPVRQLPCRRLRAQRAGCRSSQRPRGLVVVTRRAADGDAGAGDPAARSAVPAGARRGRPVAAPHRRTGRPAGQAGAG